MAGVSDVLDGYIARKYDLTTKIGAALDPLADKLMTFAVLISFTTAQLIPTWVLLIYWSQRNYDDNRWRYCTIFM